MQDPTVGTRGVHNRVFSCVFSLSLARTLSLSRLVALDAGKDAQGTPVQGHLELKKTRFTVHAGHYPGLCGWGNTCILSLSLSLSLARALA